MALRLQDILDGAQNGRWLSDPELLRSQAANCALTKADFAALLRSAKEHIDQKQADAASQLLFASLLLGGSAVEESIRSDGLFRLSRSWFDQPILQQVVNRILAAGASLPPAGHEYLESVSHLHGIAKSVRKDYLDIRAWLESEREAGIKGALATLEWLCLQHSYEYRVGDPSSSSREAAFFSPEDLADGFSTILAIYYDQFGPLLGNVLINADAAAEGAYMPRLIAGAHLAAFRDWEFIVDRLGYQVERSSDASTFRLRPPSEEFRRAIELGYIHTSMQRSIIARDHATENMLSFAEMGERICDSDSSNQFLKRVDDPIPRYRLEVPEEILTLSAQIGELMREEQLALQGACRDLHISTEELLDFSLTEEVTLRDFFLVARLLQLMRSIMATKLREVAEEDLPIVLQSIVPCFEHATLLKLFELVIGDKAEEVAGLLLLDPDGHIDVFYRPLIPAGASVLLPINVFANSNIYRNPLVVTRRRPFEDGTVDPVTEAIRTVFEQQGYAVRSGVRFSWNGLTGEVDVLVIVDDVVLALECKNSLLPTGFHELKTSVDYIRTAGTQLDRFANCFEDQAFRADLAEKTGMSFPASPVLVTGIVMANRMLIGYRQGTHAVRGRYELEQFVTKGTVEVGIGSKSVWLGKTLCGEDLRRFFEDDITYEPQWRSMTSITARYEFDACAVEVEKSPISVLALARELGLKEAEAEILKQAAEQSS